MVNQTNKQKTHRKLKMNVVVNVVMSTENYNVPRMKNAVPSAYVFIISRKCVELHNQTDYYNNSSVIFGGMLKFQLYFWVCLKYLVFLGGSQSN